MAEMSSWDQANRRQKRGLAWRIRTKISQIIKDYCCLLFFLLFILCFKHSKAESGSRRLTESENQRLPDSESRRVGESFFDYEYLREFESKIGTARVMAGTYAKPIYAKTSENKPHFHVPLREHISLPNMAKKSDQYLTLKSRKSLRQKIELGLYIMLVL